MRQTKPLDDRAPSLSSKEELILDLLLGCPSVEMYGLELVHNSRNKLKRGTIYVTLGRMQEKGYVESRQEEENNLSGLPRRLYRVTGYGQKVYRACQLAREAMNLSTADFGGAI